MFILMKLLLENVSNNYHFKYKFLKFISRCSILQSIRMLNLVILKCDAKAKFEKMFNISFKRLTQEVLKI